MIYWVRTTISVFARDQALGSFQRLHRAMENGKLKPYGIECVEFEKTTRL